MYKIYLYNHTITRGDYMKKGAMVIGCMGLAALMGYGAWEAYKMMNPEKASKVKKEMNKATKSLEKIAKDMT